MAHGFPRQKHICDHRHIKRLVIIKRLEKLPARFLSGQTLWEPDIAVCEEGRIVQGKNSTVKS
jgi:hypothetical protein